MPEPQEKVTQTSGTFGKLNIGALSHFIQLIVGDIRSREMNIIPELKAIHKKNAAATKATALRAKLRTIARLLNINQLNLENQRCIRRDHTTCTALSIGQI